MFSYREILFRSLSACWKQKYLWFLGIFAAMIGGSGVYGLTNASYNDWIVRWHSFTSTGIFTASGMHNMLKTIADGPAVFLYFLVIVIILVGILLFILWTSVVSKSAIIHGASLAHQGKQAEFGAAIYVGVKKFWPSLALVILAKAVYVIFAFILMIASFASGASAMLVFPIFLLAILVMIIVSLVFNYALAYVVVKNEKLGRSINLAFKLFFDNWLVSLEMAFLLFMIGFLATLIVLFSIMLLWVPVLVLIVAFKKVSLIFLAGLIAILAIVSIFFVIIAIGALFAAFSTAAWTGTFLALEKGSIASKLSRLFKKN